MNIWMITHPLNFKSSCFIRLCSLKITATLFIRYFAYIKFSILSYVYIFWNFLFFYFIIFSNYSLIVVISSCYCVAFKESTVNSINLCCSFVVPSRSCVWSFKVSTASYVMTIYSYSEFNSIVASDSSLYFPCKLLLSF